jgi:hypothetical protein
MVLETARVVSPEPFILPRTHPAGGCPGPVWDLRTASHNGKQKGRTSEEIRPDNRRLMKLANHGHSGGGPPLNR